MLVQRIISSCFIALGALAIITAGAILLNKYQVTLKSPVEIQLRKIDYVSPLPSEEGKIATRGAQLKLIKPVSAAEPQLTTIKGIASYYSRKGCLGCNKNLIMKNGEVLDDKKWTIALTPETVTRYNLLNRTVKVKNNNNGLSVRAKVTDTGGFGKYKRVADLSLATKNTLGCRDLCPVTITF